MINKRQPLGRGLSALLSDNNHQISNYKESAIDVDISLIQPNPWQPRKSFDIEEITNLSDSIKANGLIQPVIIRKKADGFELVAGERRMRACKHAGLKKISAVVTNLSDEDMLEMALIENIQREGLNPIEEALAYKDLSETRNYTQEQIAKRVGKSRSHISNITRLLTLPEEVRQMLIDKKLSSGHARSLVGKNNALELADKIVNKKYNVRQAEAITSTKRVNQKKEYLADPNQDSDLKAIEESLSESLGMEVSINDSHEGGVLSIKFVSLEQLDSLITKLSESNLDI
jgi:ParB family chromosome partitioning protein